MTIKMTTLLVVVELIIVAEFVAVLFALAAFTVVSVEVEVLIVAFAVVFALVSVAVFISSISNLVVVILALLLAIPDVAFSSNTFISIPPNTSTNSVHKGIIRNIVSTSVGASSDNNCIIATRTVFSIASLNKGQY